MKRYPKTEAPFIREEGVVQNEIREGFEWVFDKETVIAVEKLDGTNIAVECSNGDITGIYTRNGELKTVQNGDVEYVEGVARAIEKGWGGYLEDNGITYGELVGKRIQGNPYEINYHIWVPFKKANEWLRYKSWGEYPKNFKSMSKWFNPDKFGLIPLFYSKVHGLDIETASEEGYVEGIIFYDTETGERAKLRLDMFPWYN